MRKREREREGLGRTKLSEEEEERREGGREGQQSFLLLYFSPLPLAERGGHSGVKDLSGEQEEK